MNWRDFAERAPDLAAKAENLLDQSGFIFIGTIRKDGSPRISPVEALIANGKLYLGMMWDSLKAQDLLRDPRCTVHAGIKDRFASDGEFKLHGRTVEVKEEQERQEYCGALYKKIGWDPSQFRFHLFWIDIDTAGLFVTQDNERIFSRFRADEGLRKFRQNVEGRKEPLD